MYEHKSKLAEKKEFNIDLSSVEDNIKKMDSMQLNKHEVVRKSKENVYDLSDWFSSNIILLMPITLRLHPYPPVPQLYPDFS